MTGDEKKKRDENNWFWTTQVIFVARIAWHIHPLSCLKFVWKTFLQYFIRVEKKMSWFFNVVK
jgi:hypothetical protein